VFQPRISGVCRRRQLKNMLFISVTVTLYADNWDENTTYGRFYQDVVVVGVRKNDDTQIILADVALSGANGDIDADKVLLEAWGSISSQRVQQTMADTLRFYSMEEITVNVPVNIAIMQ